MIIKCEGEKKKRIAQLILDEQEKAGHDLIGEEDKESEDPDIEITDFYEPLAELEFLGIATPGACSGPVEIFEKIKKEFPEVEIDGFILIGDDDYRYQVYFHSESGSEKVNAEYSVGGSDFETGVPMSHCWFSYVTGNDYGPEAVGFVTKEDYENFLERAKSYAEENEMDLETLFSSGDLEEFLDEDDPYAETDEEMHEIYSLAWKKYNGITYEGGTE